MRPGEPQIQTCTLQGLPEVLRARQVEPNAFLEGFGLTADALLVRNEHIPYWQYANILREAARVCDLPHLGLELSRAATHLLYARATLGVLLKYCETVGAALEAITRFYHTTSGGAEYRLEVSGGVARFVRTGRVPGLKHERILQDMSLADYLAILRMALGDAWSPRCITFTYAPPEDTRPHAALLRAPVAFGASEQAIEFAAADLDREIGASKSLMEELVRDLVSRALAQPGADFRKAVIQAVDVLLPTGVCCANSVATAFDLHPRTLHRRLKQEDTTFAELLDSRRKKHAATYLENPAMSIGEVGYALGYTAPEAFTRAFRRWYGVAPHEWRTARDTVAFTS